MLGPTLTHTHTPRHGQQKQPLQKYIKLIKCTLSLSSLLNSLQIPQPPTKIADLLTIIIEGFIQKPRQTVVVAFWGEMATRMLLLRLCSVQ